MYPLKRLTILCGHYGSGKTNVAVGIATELKKSRDSVTVADLDIVNPYFRTKDSAKQLEDAGVTLISPQFANTNVDLPALPAEAYRLVQDKAIYGVMDIGGDDRGAYALGRYVPFIKEEGNYRMIFVANCCRPLTTTAEEALEVMREIESACGLQFTDIINNSNLGPETTAETVTESLPYIQKLSELSGLPVFAHTAECNVAKQLDLPDVFPLHLQEKYFDLPIA